MLCPAGHPVVHLEASGIAESMRRAMRNDCLLGVGVKEAHMEILGGMATKDEAIRRQSLERAYQLGCAF